MFESSPLFTMYRCLDTSFVFALQWFWTCAFGGTLCTTLAMPMMMSGTGCGDNCSVYISWLLVSLYLPVVSTFWILNAPLLATSTESLDKRAVGCSCCHAGISGACIAYMIPNELGKGSLLTAIAVLGTIGIVWVHSQASVLLCACYKASE